MSTQLSSACTLLLRAAVDSALRGLTKEYFDKHVLWEAEMRERFCRIHEYLDERPIRSEVTAVFRKLSGDYKTRYKVASHETACGMILDQRPAFCEHGSLFELSDEWLSKCAEALQSTLLALQNEKLGRPYSLMTKFLHFLYPDLFAIYDSQAAYSIWMWSLFAIEESDSRRNQFTIAKLFDPSGHSYGQVLLAYRMIWANATEEDRAMAANVTSDIERWMRGSTGMSSARFTVLDLIDKHLWKSSGNPIQLGLATTPSLKV